MNRRMDERLAASPPGDLPCLLELRAEIEIFGRSLGHAVVLEDEVETFDLTAAEWRIDVEYGKLIFAAWDRERSIVRRVEAVVDRHPGRMAMLARRQGAPSTTRLELRELGVEGPGEGAPAAIDRRQFRREFVAMLGREFPGWYLERISQRSDRQFSFSCSYPRGWARQGHVAWAFLGLSDREDPGAADSLLAFGLIWLEWLRRRSDRVAVGGLKVFLPRPAVEATAHRAACLNPCAVAVEIWEWDAPPASGAPGSATGSEGEGRERHEGPRRIDLSDYGNVETRLVPRRRSEAVAARHHALVRDLLGDLVDRVDVVADGEGTFLSLRVRGLEVARVEGEATPRVSFGMEGHPRELEAADLAEFRELLESVIRIRRSPSPDPNHEFYRWQGERWLESLLVRDLTRVDPALSPHHVYPQVPAFSGSRSSAMQRGVIDILAVARRDRSGTSHRLAVVELKLYEEINLPLQGLDYWLRVKWLHQRGQFKQFGYFPGLELTPEPPLLYLVSPAFRFHSTTGRLIDYLAPEVDVVQVGINHEWREGVKVLFRRALKRARRQPADGPAA